MKHGDKNRKFGRKAGPRKSLLRSLVRSVILKDKIRTTEAKAKELRKHVEPLVTISKKDTVANRRLVAERVGNDKEVIKKLFTEIAPKNQERAGGYTRITKLPPRKSDGSKMAVIEFVD
ncbi:50S ribosomal protein L17 [Candidatus Nomurabacteria bacterium]|nr:50S ribosomal protein L17 [Candidatus Nomurabacteria bacterium]USN94954.1 MAG: 50S ribosomal protein L17 [Candidatus Nomurabacteria bacterium]